MAEKYAYLAVEYVGESLTELETNTEIGAAIKAIKEHGQPLLDVLRSVRGPTIKALNAAIGKMNGQTLAEIEEGLGLLVNAAKNAEPRGGKDYKGPQRSETARKIALQAANDYFDITQRRPGRGNHEAREPAGRLAEIRLSRGPPP